MTDNAKYIICNNVKYEKCPFCLKLNDNILGY